MKAKKLLSLLMVGILTLSSVACGSNDKNLESGSGESDKIVVWTLAADLKEFATHYEEMNEGKTIDVVEIKPEDYVTKVTTALRGKSKVPDVIVGEPQMLPNLFEAGFFEDLSQAPYNVGEYENEIVPYIYDIGKDEEGKVRALSYQVTPGGITYRRDIAEAVWGDDSPEFVATKFKDVNTIIETGKELKDKGYRVFASTGDLRHFTYGNDPEPWVKDDELMMTQGRLDYFDAAVELHQDKLVAFAPEWSSAWYGSMGAPVPVDAEWTDIAEMDTDAEKTEVFAYSLATWGSVIVRDNAKGTPNEGKFGITTGPNSFYMGGTFIGINTFSKNKEAAWDFVKFCTLDKEVSQWWIEKSEGDVVSLQSVLEANKDYENPAFANQKTYEFWSEQADKVDYSLVTKYDDEIGNFFGQAIGAVQNGEKTKEEALKEFYKNVKTVYPEVNVPEN